jgi:hypothetical protein
LVVIAAINWWQGSSLLRCVDVLEGREAHSMNWSRAKSFYSGEVFLRPVSLMPRDPVAGVLKVKILHQGITVDLRDDAGRSNRDTEGITVLNDVLAQGCVNLHRIDQEMVRCGIALQDSSLHGQFGRLVDVESVDGRGIYFNDGDRSGGIANLFVESLTLLL